MGQRTKPRTKRGTGRGKGQQPGRVVSIRPDDFDFLARTLGPDYFTDSRLPAKTRRGGRR